MQKVVSLTTPKLITDYPTPYMFPNELGRQAFLNCKWFAECFESISTCVCCFSTSVDVFLEFSTPYYHVPIECTIGDGLTQPNANLKRKTG